VGGTYLHGLTFDQVVERIPVSTDCIGISANFSYDWPTCRDLLIQIRQRFPKALLIAGGEHATAAPEFSLSESTLDVIVMGEAERTTGELLKTYQERGITGLAEVPGIVYKDAVGEIHKTGSATRISDLKSIPWPAWDLLPMEEYLSRGHGFGVNRGRSVPILASRGCPYQCTFCSNPEMWTVRWKARDPNDVLDEIVYLQKQYQATNFDFYDLTMIVKKEWIVDFCRAIEHRQMQFTWQLPSGTRSEAIDEEVTQLLYQTGCRNLSYAPESGSEETLRIIKKRVSIPKLMTSMRTAVQQNLNVKCNFIFGFPLDRWKNILESFWAIIQSAWVGIHDIAIWVFVPYPGSELFHQLQAEGKIQHMDDAYFMHLAAYGDITKTFSYCRALSKNELLAARIFGTCLFYGTSWLFRPWRPLRSVCNLITGHIESRSEHALRTTLKRTSTVVTDLFKSKKRTVPSERA
jgi:radical SAM superfamily enzyme YgiQ (UPF0313 family)